MTDRKIQMRNKAESMDRKLNRTYKYQYNQQICQISIIS